MRYLIFLLTTACFLAFSACSTTGHYSKDHTKVPSSMVVCSHPAAARAGTDILKAGGNAFDAAIATQFALAVVYPRAGNIGGGGLLIYRDHEGRSMSLDFRECAPLAATSDMFLDNRGKVIAGMSLTGVYASGVPGSVEGMWTLHKEKGSLPWCQLVQPAIDIASGGVALTEHEARHLNQYSALIDSVTGSATAFGRRQWRMGDTLVQPDLATTLTYIRDYGRDGFYRGPTATSILATMILHQGLITQKDLDGYHAVWRQPVTARYKGYDISLMPPPSSGGILIAQMLRAMELSDLSRKELNTAGYIHGLTEIQRRAYADRSEYFGDPDFVDNHRESLLSDAYIREKYSGIDPERATPSHQIKAGKVDRIESFETTHFSVADRYGNAVAVTTTLNGNYGSKLVVSRAGFLLNNEMDDFSIKPGSPNQFGLIGGFANSIKPGKRMLSSMTPTIISRDGRLYAVIGTPGGSTIITVNLQIIADLIDFNMDMQQAVIAPKMHSQWLPDEVYLEKGKFSSEVIRQLQNMGHKVVEVPALGKPDCIRVRPDGSLEGGTDPAKGDGTVESF